MTNHQQSYWSAFALAICAVAVTGSGGCCSTPKVQSVVSTPHESPDGAIGTAPWGGVVKSVRGTVTYSEHGNPFYTTFRETSSPLEENQVIASGSVIRSKVDGFARLTLGDDSLDLALRDSTVLAFTGIQRGFSGADSFADISLKLMAGTIQGDLKRTSPFSMLLVTTPNVVFVVPGWFKTKFEISANGVAHVMEGSLSAVWLEQWGMTNMVAKTVTGGQTFQAPTNNGMRPGVVPILRPTREGELNRWPP